MFSKLKPFYLKRNLPRAGLTLIDGRFFFTIELLGTSRDLCLATLVMCLGVPSTNLDIDESVSLCLTDLSV